MARRSSALAMRSPIMFTRAGGKPGGSGAALARVKRENKERLARISARTRQHVSAQKHRYISIGVGLGLGLLRRYVPETMESLSFAGGMITPELTIGLGALLAGMFVKNDILDHLATAGLTVAAYQFGSGAGVEGDTDDMV